MIRAFSGQDLDAVMEIWLDVNIKAHGFIAETYWTGHYPMVREMMPQAEVYLYEGSAGWIDGFIGLAGGYIAGIFVREAAQSKGIGKQLLDYAKGSRQSLHLNVYRKNTRAVRFYQREQFIIQSENTDDATREKEFLMAWEK